MHENKNITNKREMPQKSTFWGYFLIAAVSDAGALTISRDVSHMLLS